MTGCAAPRHQDQPEPTAAGRWVPLKALAGDRKLTPDQKIHLVSLAIEWLAAAQALVMIHGERRAAQRLAELGCPVRFDDDEPVIWSPS